MIGEEVERGTGSLGNNNWWRNCHNLAGGRRTYVCANSSKTGKPSPAIALRAFYPHNAAKEGGKNVVQSRVFVVVVRRRRRIVGGDGTIAIASTGSSSGSGIGANAGEPRGGGAADGGSKTSRRTSNGGSSVRDWWCRLERWDR